MMPHTEETPDVIRVVALDNKLAAVTASVCSQHPFQIGSGVLNRTGIYRCIVYRATSTPPRIYRLRGRRTPQRDFQNPFINRNIDHVTIFKTRNIKVPYLARILPYNVNVNFRITMAQKFYKAQTNSPHISIPDIPRKSSRFPVCSASIYSCSSLSRPSWRATLAAISFNLDCSA